MKIKKYSSRGKNTSHKIIFFNLLILLLLSIEVESALFLTKADRLFFHE